MSKQNDQTNDQALDADLYQKREKLYVREVHGIWARMRFLAMTTLLALYYGIAWISWNGQQIVLFDLPERKFHILGLTFWPQDFIYLSALLIIAALALFLFTALAGRLWCGYACPQTVWTEIFMWFERKIEGDSRAQKKRDQGPRNFDYYRVKASKHLVWLLFALWTGFTFVGYFTPIRELAVHFMQWQLGPWETFWIFFYGFATYGNAGWMREQVCIYMCPYARFQSAMIDRNTLMISYDAERGDPRGARKRGIDSKSIDKGDCIDCSLCTQVCPTGIDIRDGLQYQCIGCAACIDVCDEVMDKMGYAKGLIRYTTENALEGLKTRILRPRIFVYIGLISVVSIALLYALVARVPLEIDIIRDRSALYTLSQDGMIENIYNLKVINMQEQTRHYAISASGLEGLRIVGKQEIRVGSGQVADLPLRIQVPPDAILKRSNTIHFHIESIEPADVSLSEPARFLGPVAQ